MTVFVDSNVPMYVAGRDHPHREPARRFLGRVRAGEIDAVTSTEVLQEILYRYTSLRRPELARQVYTLFVDICPVVLPITLADTDCARDLVCAGKGIGARDALHAAVMANHRIRLAATFDQAFDRIPGVGRFNLD